MNKRNFLSTSLLGAVAGAAALPGLANAQNGPRSATGPTLLTVSGAIGAGNRGALDPALDQMMAKQKLQFSKAQAFDFAALTALPAVTIKPTLEYDSKPHTLKGPLLANVMKACGVKVTDKAVYFLRAIDGYAAQISAADATKYRFIVATHLDGRPMALGGLGPLWAVYDADRFADMAAKPLKERFATCPWATYHIEVKES
ncbi:MAG: molybdopterin-dependent oxidoreductase [Polaromonas sp.]